MRWNHKVMSLIEQVYSGYSLEMTQLEDTDRFDRRRCTVTMKDGSILKFTYTAYEANYIIAVSVSSDMYAQRNGLTPKFDSDYAEQIFKCGFSQNIYAEDDMDPIKEHARETATALVRLSRSDRFDILGEAIFAINHTLINVIKNPISVAMIRSDPFMYMSYSVTGNITTSNAMQVRCLEQATKEYARLLLK